MLTANLGNGQMIIGDAAVTGLVNGVGGAGLAGTAQVQELQNALRGYGQAAGHPSAAAVQPTGQIDMQTLMALASIAPQLRARVPGQVPDAVWHLLTALGTSPRNVSTGQIDAQVASYAGLLAEAVRALTYARMTGGALAPPVPRPVISALSGAAGRVPTWAWIVGGVAVLGIAAYFVMRQR